jgi:hypothetical protein
MNLAYSRVMTLLKALAPARLHMATSSFIYQTNIFEVEASFRNTRAFLSFQISHEINIASDDMSFFHCPCLCTPSIHHSLTERIVWQSLMSTSFNPSQDLTLDHIRMAKRYLKRRWLAVSCTSLHSLHTPQFGHPLFWSLSDVHTLF